MKRKIFMGMMIAILLSTTTNAHALGNATVEFTGENQVHIGETFTVNMSVINVEGTYDGIVSLGGNLSFDHTKLEYVSSKEVEAPYVFQINEDYNYKLAGLDFTLDNGIKTNTTVFEFTFKALESGNTTITLENFKLTDSKDYVDTNVISKVINIEEPIKELENLETVTSMEVSMNKVEVKEETKENIITISNKQEREEDLIQNIEEDQLKETVKSQNFQSTRYTKETVFGRIQKIVSNLFETVQKLFTDSI